MSLTKSLSHVESIFTNDDIKRAVRKIKEAYGRGNRVSLASNEIADVQTAYREEMADAEARTFVLVSSFINKYWGPASTKSTMTLEAICSCINHKTPIVVAEDLTAEHISYLLSDERLTESIVKRHKELQTCDAHGALVEVEKSFITHSPYDSAVRVLNSRNYSFGQMSSKLKNLPKYQVIGLTSRIKSPGDLSDKITDKILGVDKIVRHDKIPSKDDEVKDLSGIGIVTTNKKMCYKVLEYIRSRDDLLIVDPKDYIKEPKDNNYRALHVIVGYSGLYHEIQILDTEMFDWNRSHPLVSHTTYRDALKQARNGIGPPWFDLNRRIRQLFVAKPAHEKK